MGKIHFKRRGSETDIQPMATGLSANYKCRARCEKGRKRSVKKREKHKKIRQTERDDTAATKRRKNDH